MNNPIKSHMNTRTVSSRLFRFETAARTATPIAAIVSSALLAMLAGGLPGNANAADFAPLGEGILPSGKFVQDYKYTLYPGETVPWHYHPGKVYVVVVSGTLTEEKGCGRPAETITAGSAFTELPGVIHRVFNYGTEPVEIIVTAIVPPRFAGYQGTILVSGPRCDD
jgi:quercetin dioxygenase-like cupin family protein